MESKAGYLLHRRPYGNSSEILYYLTEQGLIHALAKGSKKPKSHFYGQLQYFVATTLAWQGRSDLKTLVSAEQSGLLPPIPYNNHVAMMYLNELLMLLRIDNSLYQSIYPQYQNTLKQLQADNNIALILRRSEWFLCCLLGYQLEVPDHINNSDYIQFSVQEGLILDDLSKKCTAQNFIDFINNKSCDIKGINWLMRVVVRHLVNGRPIKSRELWC